MLWVSQRPGRVRMIGTALECRFKSRTARTQQLAHTIFGKSEIQPRERIACPLAEVLPMGYRLLPQERLPCAGDPADDMVSSRMLEGDCVRDLEKDEFLDVFLQ